MNLLKRCERGAAAVEFALIAPVLILLVFGMIAYGIFLGAAHSVQEIASDAARTALAGLDEPERQKLVQDFISANGDSYAFVAAAKLTYQVANAAADPNQLTVSVTLDAAGLPIWNLLPPNLLPSSDITRTVSIRIGGI